jgi:CheY-like chemotaxis protein
MLGFLGFNPKPAYGSRQALLLLSKYTPSIIFLDINMPGVDGFEILSYLYRLPGLNGIPVVVVTSDDQPETAKRAKNGGAVDLLVKPVSLEVLETALQNIRFKDEE